MLLCLLSMRLWLPKFSGYARRFRCFLFLRARGFARADGRDNLCSPALTTIREILMNDAALRRLIKYRCQDIQLNLRFGLVAGRNRPGQPFLLTFQSGQDAFIKRSALFGLSFSLSGRSRVRHIVRFRKSTETITSFNRVKQAKPPGFA
jgi:hypothetical protein